MKTHEHLSSAKATVGLLVFLIAVVIFWKFWTNQDYFFEDVNAMRNYIVFAIIGGGFLVGLLYLTSQTTHKVVSKSSKSSKSKRKKK